MKSIFVSKTKILYTVITFLLIGCSARNSVRSEKRELSSIKDTIAFDAILDGIKNGDLTIKYLNQSNQEVDYKLSDTLNIDLSYKGKFSSLNDSYKLTAHPITDNLKIKWIGENRYQLVIDTSKDLTEFRYEIKLASTKCLFKTNYPNLNFSSYIILQNQIHTLANSDDPGNVGTNYVASGEEMKKGDTLGGNPSVNIYPKK